MSAFFILIGAAALALLFSALGTAARATWPHNVWMVAFFASIAVGAAAFALPEPSGGADTERITGAVALAWAIALRPTRTTVPSRVITVAIILLVGYVLPQPGFGVPNYRLGLLMVIPLALMGTEELQSRVVRWARDRAGND